MARFYPTVPIPMMDNFSDLVYLYLFLFSLGLLFVFVTQYCCAKKTLVLSRKQNSKSSMKQSLGDRMKEYEKSYETRLSPHKWFVVRLDGKSFSKFTRGFDRPMDSRIKNAMVNTAKDLVETHKAYCAYTASDEITLIFPPIENEKQTLMFNGRVQKIVSVLAGYTTLRFNYRLEQESEISSRKLGKAYFDARVYSVDHVLDTLYSIWWRHKLDTYRNGVFSLARTKFTTKQLQHKKVKDMIEMLGGKGIILSDYDTHLYYGTFVKKRQIQKEAQNRTSFLSFSVLRNEVHTKSFAMSDFSRARNLKIIAAKYYNLDNLDK